MADIINEPIKFLNATVLSFNTSLGLGSAEESSLNVDLIEDCEADPPDRFMPAYNEIEVGAPVHFSTSVDGTGFNFGGVLTNWTVTQGGSGKTYNVKVTDPRQLLQNAIVVVDSNSSPPVQSKNYFNVFAAYEGGGDCASFGSSGVTERGVPYNKVMSKLSQMGSIIIIDGIGAISGPMICSPTGYQYIVNLASFPQGVPDYYRVQGPGVSLLQLLDDVCNTLGLAFYVNLIPGTAVINIGTIDLKVVPPPDGFSNIITQFDGKATDLSYGEELRNEVTKTMLIGEKVHYLSPVSNFNFYFGEEWDGNDFVPVVPFKFDECYGFWIAKRIPEVNVTLNKPLPGIGPYTITEYDIKAAMASFDAWMARVTNPGIQGSFNAAVRNNFNQNVPQIRQVLDQVLADPDVAAEQKWKRLCDIINGPEKGKLLPDLIQQDLENLHQFIQNLGTTYYGKQWLTPLNENVCFKLNEAAFGEKIFSSTPTNAGGWVDPGIPVLGLTDPDLGFFRETDDRIAAFAVFAIDDGNVPQEEKDSPPQDYDVPSSPGETLGGPPNPS